MLGLLRRAYRVAHSNYIYAYNLGLRQWLKTLDDYSYTKDYVTSHAQNWRVWLGDWIGKPETHFLEIGSYEGRSSVWFLQNVLTHPTSTLDCVDPFINKGSEARFDHNICRSGRARQVRKHKGPSDAILPELPRAYFDVVYIDGSHRAADVLLDAALSWHLLKCGGLMIFDDYLWGTGKPAAQRPQTAIDLFLEAYAPRLEVIHQGYQVAVRRVG
ncbi:MAG: class I SAM-dependent methyltransferase [Anaerolineae bacterium]|nr:class I SAM-dependent methyltransferase [Anaerolineales bacterium]MDW8350265.1 class I SAM-dependent methyltransferase [Anaerolineae bacterium]